MGSYQMVDVSQVEARNGIFRALTDQLGVAGFRINQLELAAGAEGPEHDHIGNDQEEVYAVVAGGGVLRTGGEEIPLRAGHFVYLPPDVRRQMVAGDKGLTWIGIGSTTDYTTSPTSCAAVTAAQPAEQSLAARWAMGGKAAS